MPEALVHKPSPAEVRLDRQLLAGLLICPFAVLCNTIVGYTVSHWVCAVSHKRTDFLVCFCDLCLCLLAAWLSFAGLRKLPRADETQPELGRRRFMAILGLVLSAFSIIIVLAGTIATLTLQPCD
jgi:hypothetical protein